MSKADSHAAASIHTAQRSEMDIPQDGKTKAIASLGAASQRHRNKQNLNYVWRSGLAGGLAACAVSTSRVSEDRELQLTQI